MPQDKEKAIKMKILDVTVQCMASYNSYILVPSNMDIDEAISYTKNKLSEIPLSHMKYINDSDELCEEDCSFENDKFFCSLCDRQVKKDDKFCEHCDTEFIN